MAIQQRYKDSKLSVDERVTHLLELMTVEEKVAQLAGVWASDLFDPQSKAFMLDKARQRIPHGTGHITRVGVVSMLPPQQSAELANSIQRYLVNETRLGLPGIVHEESCAGYLAKDATTFPQAIGLAATWEPELIETMTTFIRQQMRAVGAHLTLAPVLDIARDPRWGRFEETFGEDPFLVTAIGLAYINGLQRAGATERIVATAKHFIGYGLPEGGMNWAPSHIPERLLREVYLPPFAAAVQQAQVGAVMNGYQEIDGVPCGSSQALLVDLLRGELGFDSTIVADYFTINMFIEYHRIAANKGEAARYGLEAGIDVELPDADCYGQPLLDALEAGEIALDLVDASVTRVLRQKIQLGLLEQPYVDSGRVPDIYSDPAAKALSKQLAQKSLVLLENKDDYLPLSKQLRRIAVIGPNADDPRNMQGDYHYPAHMEGIINHDENMDAPSPSGKGYMIDWNDHRPVTTTVLQGICEYVSESTQVTYTRGCDVTGDDQSGFAEAITQAQQADVAIVVVGDRSGLGLDSTTGEAVDRATLELPGVQQALVEAITNTETPIIVVVMNGRPPVLTAIAEQVDALILAWLPAEAGGSAIAETIFGDSVPGGKLPMTLPRHVGQVPRYYNHKPSGGRSHWHGDYVDMSAQPLYPFGYGLSYTTFTYDQLTLSQTRASASETITVIFNITNSGNLAGEEVVQLYIADPIASVTRPVKQLKAFKRVALEAGQTKQVQIALPIAHFAFYDRNMCYTVEAGTVQVMIGSSARDIHLQAEIEIIDTVHDIEAVYTTAVEVNEG
ncbi:MAG: glycoside hydrolase family 3 N-terminal domain-containing protein [Anaerolineae bacterium]